MKSKKNVVKLTLDLAMGITFALLYNTRVLGGLAFHEIAGIAIGFAFATHILLNARFVRKVTLRLFDRTLPLRTRLSHWLNILLLVSMTLVIFSGLVISKVELPSFQFGNENWFRTAHEAVSYAALGLIGIHIGLHWHWVIKVVQKLFRLRMPKPLSSALMTGAAVVVLLFGAYEAYSTNYISKLEMVQGMFSSSSAQFGHGDRGEMKRPPMETDQAGQSDQSGQTGQTGQTGQANLTPATGAASADTAVFDADRGGDFRDHGGRGDFKGEGGGASWWNVLLAQFGIMALFAGIVYYADKWIGRSKQHRRRSESSRPTGAQAE